MKFLSRSGPVSLIIFTFILVCSQNSFAQTTVKEIVGKVALIPFSSKSSLSYEQSETSLEQIERYLTISLYEALVVEADYVPDVEMLPLKKSDTEYNKLRDGKPKIYYKDIAIDTGRILDADSVMVGTISQYSDRSGSEWGVEAPSTVSFSVQLLSTKDGKVLWETYYTETQQPLFDNILEIKKFVKRGGKWVTVDELAKEGARTVAKRFGRFLLENK